MWSLARDSVWLARKTIAQKQSAYLLRTGMTLYIYIFFFFKSNICTALPFVCAVRARTIIIVMVIVIIMRLERRRDIHTCLVVNYTFDWLHDLSQGNEERLPVQHLSRNIVTSNFWKYCMIDEVYHLFLERLTFNYFFILTVNWQHRITECAVAFVCILKRNLLIARRIINSKEKSVRTK